MLAINIMLLINIFSFFYNEYVSFAKKNVLKFKKYLLYI